MLNLTISSISLTIPVPINYPRCLIFICPSMAVWRAADSGVSRPVDGSPSLVPFEMTYLSLSFIIWIVKDGQHDTKSPEWQSSHLLNETNQHLFDVSTGIPLLWQPGFPAKNQSYDCQVGKAPSYYLQRWRPKAASLKLSHKATQSHHC